MKSAFIIFSFVLAVSGCAQNTKNNTPIKESITINNQNTMDLSKISNPTVKNAIEALQANDKNAWYAFFTDDVTFTDDGRTMNFKSFFDNAFNHKEKFLTIDQVDNDGKNITGNFYAGQWGTFKVFFNFHQQADGKFNRLDIGQAR